MDRKKVVPLEDRLPQLKKERKQKANRRFIFYASFFFLLILVVIYFQSPLSKVSQISVSGEQLASSGQVIQASGISDQTHIWDVRPATAENRIEKLPTVQTASVRTVFPNRVTIQIKEYDRKAYLEKNGGYYPILQNGALLGKLPGSGLPVDAPILYGFSRQAELSAVTEGLAKIPQQVIHSISDIHYIPGPTNNDNLVLYMNDGNRVVASTTTFVKNIQLYPEIAANLPKGAHGTIHLSVGSYFVPDSAKSSAQN
ncbi:cell division protein FtsQ/DivIB [Sporolactobacillus putidus]|uniref:Cell division protein DivIB n=1 Tax=Sporolactobacillus putidus TaxID=492735 RepID=A0A917RYE9_9BACL|nr:FtsQ-type POTRA domain-containing protein [Sporolactobacillus putidus]GGL44742.1 cell division protein DivIB [Sporolactobacillus putidus]